MAQLAEHLNSVEAHEQGLVRVRREPRRRCSRHCRKGVQTGSARSASSGRFRRILPAGGVLKSVRGVSDHRARRSIPMFFFCNTLVPPAVALAAAATDQDTLFARPGTAADWGSTRGKIDAGFCTQLSRQGETVHGRGDC